MKRSFLAPLALLALACALLATACPKDPEPGNTESSWLVGKWSNQVATFEIKADMTFICDLTSIDPTGSSLMPARCYGKLSKDMAGLNTNDYHMANMTAGSGADPDQSYIAGNTGLATQLLAFQNLVGTLTPNADKDEFVFTSVNGTANAFFGAQGAPYVKQP